MHITIATHHCGSGNTTTEKVSIDGGLASCGMEGPEDQCSLPGTHFSKHCCDDKVSVLAVDNNYSPSFTNFTAFAQHLLQIYIVPVSLEIHALSVINLISTSVSPHGNFLIHAVSLPKICVFLI